MSSTTQRGDEESGSSHPAFSRLSILRTLWKRKIRIAVACVFFGVGAAVVVRLLPAVYLSETVVLIDSQKIPEKFVSATVGDDEEERIASIRQTLLSGTELKKVIEEFGLYREEKKTHFEEEILELMRKDISITLESAMPGSNDKTKRPGAFRIGFQGSQPALVMQVANRLTDLYVERNLKSREGEAAGTSEFLDTQLLDAKKHLDELEAAVSAYKLGHTGELPQQESSLSATLARLQTELEANRDAINRANQTKVILQSTINATDATIAGQTRSWDQLRRGEEVTALPGHQSTTQRSRESEVLEDQLAQLRARYTETHPEVVRVRKALENMKRAEAQRDTTRSDAAAAAGQSAGGAAPNRSTAAALTEPPEFARTREQLAGLTAQIKGAEAELTSRQAEQQRILNDLDLYQRRIEQLPVREQEMAQLTRDYEMSKINYQSLLDKKMAAEMSLNMERRQQAERFVILDRAQLPQKPIKPNRPVLYSAGSGVALILGLLVGFVTELRQNVFLGEWELPPGTPVLGRLPYIEVLVRPGQEKAKPGNWFRRRKGFAGAAVASLIVTKMVVQSWHSVLDRL